MAAISFEVLWSDTSGATFNQDNSQLVGDVVENIEIRAGEQLPERDANGDTIEYALFKDNNGHREPIHRKRTLNQAGIRNGDRLYLANRHAPWWEVNKKPGTTTLRRQRKAIVMPSVLPQPAVQPDECLFQLQLAPGCVITVSSTETLDLNRNYLLQKLPSSIVTREKARIFAGLNSRLNSVSREQHCQIFRQGDQWLLRAFRPTYIYTRTIDKGMTVTLATSTTIVLGREGWSIEVLFSST